MSTKSEQRCIARKIMCSLSREYVESSSSTICKRVLCTREFVEAKSIFVYLSFQNEVKTSEIIEVALKLGKRVAVPKTVEGNMIAVALDSVTELSPDSFGILEPVGGVEIEPELIIMPMLAYNDKRVRLGRGKGYYDRYMDGRNIKSIGLAFSVQKQENLIFEEHDYIPDMIVTEEEFV